MYENPVSKRTNQQNILKTRVQVFQNNYQQSLKRIRSNSTMHSLAGNVYTYKQNQIMSPKKAMRRPASTSMLARMEENPENLRSSAMKGLNTRASHIANYSDINTSLLLERRQLEERSAYLREEIAKERRLKDKSEMNCRKNQNDIQKGMNQIKELGIRSDRLNDAITQAKQDISENRRVLNQCQTDNAQTMASIHRELKYIDELENRCKMLKNHLLVQDKNRTMLKGDLIKAQKVMNAASISTRELEQERANMLLEINKSVEQNKLQ